MDKKLVLAVAGSGKTYYICQMLVEDEKNLILAFTHENIKNIRNDLALMVIGERVNAKIGDFAAVSMELKTKNQIYSAMVIYGLLTYNNGQVFIPNKELMLKYDELLFRES